MIIDGILHPDRYADMLPSGIEQVIPAASTLEATVRQVLRDTGLDRPRPI